MSLETVRRLTGVFFLTFFAASVLALFFGIQRDGRWRRKTEWALLAVFVAIAGIVALDLAVGPGEARTLIANYVVFAMVAAIGAYAFRPQAFYAAISALRIPFLLLTCALTLLVIWHEVVPLLSEGHELLSLSKKYAWIAEQEIRQDRGSVAPLSGHGGPSEPSQGRGLLHAAGLHAVPVRGAGVRASGRPAPDGHPGLQAFGDRLEQYLGLVPRTKLGGRPGVVGNALIIDLDKKRVSDLMNIYPRLGAVPIATTPDDVRTVIFVDCQRRDRREFVRFFGTQSGRWYLKAGIDCEVSTVPPRGTSGAGSVTVKGSEASVHDSWAGHLFPPNPSRPDTEVRDVIASLPISD